MTLDDHLFRRESGRMVAVLTRLFGVHNLALAEDVVQDAFCRALEVWPFRGVPDNPSAWLMATARNRAIDVLRRERTARTFAPELGRLLESEWTLAPMVDEAFTGASIQDDQLRMMFSCCHPRLPEDAQIALVLNILCGFGVDEIAAAFFSSKAAIQKRLARGKKTLAGSKRLFDLAGADVEARLSAVRRALYLLFNEGYHGASAESAVRIELCREALRLTRLLVETPVAATPATLALAALMCLHLARVPGRVDESGRLQGLRDQDRSRWDRELIREGIALLDRAGPGPDASEYHFEAAIAAVHVSAPSLPETNWDLIVTLYDRLLEHRQNPAAALSRAIALAERDGPQAGIDAIRAIDGAERLARYPFYEAALGELELRGGQPARAEPHFRAAALQARSPMERRFFEARLQACRRVSGTGSLTRTAGPPSGAPRGR
jgi:RNA polymerase sigma factor (sigma-70 family)